MTYRSAIITFLAIVGFILLMDEIAYYWWRELNPGATFTGLAGKRWLQNNDIERENVFPNGHRPAGGQ